MKKINIFIINIENKNEKWKIFFETKLILRYFFFLVEKYKL